ncbi:MAG: hypothetical protein FWB80_07580 [Defluviitaleaceae bacterium]|nr:hypothetical protein [Defluviitaleaceae bacterium]
MSRYAEKTNYNSSRHVLTQIDTALKTAGLQTRTVNSIKRTIGDILRVELENAFNCGYVDGAKDTNQTQHKDDTPGV